MNPFFKYIALSSTALIILASCAGKQSYSPEAVNDAEQLYLTKQYAEAALAFNQQANSTAGTEQILLLLRTVIAYIKAEQLTQAVQLFILFKLMKAI